MPFQTRVLNYTFNKVDKRSTCYTHQMIMKCWLFFVLRVNNGDWTELSTIQSIVMSDWKNLTKAWQESDLINPENDYRHNWMSQSPIIN